MNPQFPLYIPSKGRHDSRLTAKALEKMDVPYKITTQSIKGGNTAEFYSKEGTYPKSKMQVDMHPDISKMVHKFGRIHHHVDYSSFKKNKLIRQDSSSPEVGINNYGMELLRV